MLGVRVIMVLRHIKILLMMNKNWFLHAMYNYVDYSLKIQFWVATELALASHLSKRVQLMKKFIKIASQ